MARRKGKDPRSGCSYRQLERWRDAGLLLPLVQHGKGRGCWYEEPDDTPDRVAIIFRVLKREEGNLLDAGYELFLLGYMLSPAITRRVLLKQLDDEDLATQAHFHQPLLYTEAGLAQNDSPTEAEAAAQRYRLNRSLQPKLAQLSQGSQSVIQQGAHAVTGVARLNSLADGFPSNALLRLAIIHTDDGTLVQASSEAISYLQANARDLRRYEYEMGLTSQQVARHLLLPLHTCTYQHTHEQAWRPLLTMLALCPAWESAIAEKDQQLLRPLVVRLARDMQMAGYFR